MILTSYNTSALSLSLFLFRSYQSHLILNTFPIEIDYSKVAIARMSNECQLSQAVKGGAEGPTPRALHKQVWKIRKGTVIACRGNKRSGKPQNPQVKLLRPLSHFLVIRSFSSSASDTSFSTCPFLGARGDSSDRQSLHSAPMANLRQSTDRYSIYDRFPLFHCLFIVSKILDIYLCVGSLV